MSVELKVTLVGEDPQQQQAFNNPNPAPASPTSAPSQTMPEHVATKPTLHFPSIEYLPLPDEQRQARQQNQPQTQPVQQATQQNQPLPQPVQQPTTSPTAPASQSTSTPTNTATDSQPKNLTPEQSTIRLIDSIEELIASIDSMSSQASRPSSSQSGRQPAGTSPGWFERFSNSFEKKLDEIGLKNTAVGNLLSGLVTSVAGSGSRLASLAGSFFTGGRSASTAATTAASSAAGTAATGGAATTAAGTAGGTTAASSLAATSGPLLAVAAAAAATALSMKLLMDAVNKTATELEDISPAIASVRAQNQVAMEMRRLDRAQRIGGDVANLEAARNKLTEGMYELQTKIYELLLKASPAIEFGFDSLSVIVRTLDVLIATVNNIAAKITPDPTDNAPAAKALADSLTELQKAIAELGQAGTGPNQVGIDPIFQAILDANIVQGNRVPAPNRGNGMPKP